MHYGIDSYFSIIFTVKSSPLTFTKFNWYISLWGVCACSVSLVVSNYLSLHGLQLPDSCVHGIPQVRKLEWVTMPSSRASSWLRDQTQFLTFLTFLISLMSLTSTCIAGGFITTTAIWEVLWVVKYYKTINILLGKNLLKN